jgi:hypothetical protein
MGFCFSYPRSGTTSVFGRERATGFGMSVCPVSIALKTMLSQTGSVQAQVDTQGPPSVNHHFPESYENPRTMMSARASI